MMTGAVPIAERTPLGTCYITSTSRRISARSVEKSVESAVVYALVMRHSECFSVLHYYRAVLPARLEWLFGKAISSKARAARRKMSVLNRTDAP